MYGWEKLKGELEKLAPHHCFGSCRATPFSLRTFESYSASKCPAQENPMSAFERRQWEWENATAGAIAGFATVAAMHPLDVVRTRFAVNDGRLTNLPFYKNTAHAIFTITRLEGLRGLYAGFYPAVLGSTVSWGLYFLFYGRAKQRYSKNGTHTLSPGLHLAAAAEAGALVSFCTNPIWLIKTRLQLETPLHQSRPYSGLYGCLPSTLTNLTNLQVLDIACNFLSGGISGNLPRNLRYFDLSYDAISNNIPASIGELQLLQYLWLDSNQLYGAIPSAISICSSLLHLSAEGAQGFDSGDARRDSETLSPFSFPQQTL